VTASHHGDGEDDDLETLEAGKIKEALQVQHTPGRRNMRSLRMLSHFSFQDDVVSRCCTTFAVNLNTKSFDCIIYLAPSATLKDLLDNPKILLQPDQLPATQCTLSYNSKTPIKFGAFKTALVGYSSKPLFGESHNICLKQCFYQNPGSVTFKPYDGCKQAEKLTVELNCLGWASALMNIVYRFIEKEEGNQGKQPEFEVPKMRFVKSGLAITVIDDEKTAYLVEEVIDNTEEGWFVKYLNNDSAIPRVFARKEWTIRAEFLSFAQHVQFLKTDGTAYVSDFQGKYAIHLLQFQLSLLPATIPNRWPHTSY
jgi:hypothetical protein